MVTLSRKRRCSLADMVWSSQVATAETASATAANRSRPGLWSISPWPSSANQNASSASGSAATSVRAKETPISAGSNWKPRRHSRHIDESAGGSRSSSGEDIEGHLFLAFLGRALGEPLRLQREHRPVAAAQFHQLVVAAELDDGPVLHDRDPVDVPDRGEPVRDEDRRDRSRGREDPFEDLRFTSDVKLGRWLVEQHEPGPEPYRRQRPREGYALPLPA